ncbi:unnamed protein product [Litomosoides sigmodontis]|uniref:Uncharacterized protein n=1 Tax=Litomosoides sigmodontis TaxID=42156 RepID=A0A3P6TUI1_LITSI|nr:unnamed protein product [Litomosoides sigmodontis]
MWVDWVEGNKTIPNCFYFLSAVECHRSEQRLSDNSCTNKTNGCIKSHIFYTCVFASLNYYYFCCQIFNLMSARIFGVGLGVIVMVLIWTFNIISCVICIRIRRNFLAITALVVEVIITLIIISWPLAAPTTISEEVELSIDYVGIPRFILVIVEALTLLLFCIEYVKYDLTTPTTALSAALD